MQAPPIAPSGEQVEIAFGEQQAVIAGVGGGLRSYSASGRAVVDGYGVDELSTSGRGQVLLPWPNRLQDGSYEFDGRSHQLALTEPSARNAIHGLVRWSAWTVADRDPHRVVLEHVLHAQPGYPFTLALKLEYALSDGGLEVRTTATNVGSSALSLRERRPSLPDRRDGHCRPSPAAHPRAHGAHVRRARAPCRRDERGGNGVRLPRGGARSARRRSTTHSPTSSAARTGSPASSFTIRRAAARSRSGSTGATRT